MLALVREGEPVPASATPYVLSLQQLDGGWEFLPGFGSDSNTTALVLQALIAAGVDRLQPDVREGLAYLQSLQNGDGGFGFGAGSDSDPNSSVPGASPTAAAPRVASKRISGRYLLFS